MASSLGAVGLIDALGFKGIWHANDPDEVAATLRSGRSSAKGMSKDVLREALQYVSDRAGARPKISTVAFSDTFLFSVVVEGAREREATLAGAAAVVARGISQIVRNMAKGPVPLTFRGIITADDCIIDPDNQIFIGPAVDEAAELMNLANGAFIWLAPSAARLDYTGWAHSSWPDLFVEYSVPLKNGSSILTKVVNPFAFIPHEHPEFKQMRVNHRKAMESVSIDVEVKRQNTEALFDHFEQLSRSFEERMRLRKVRTKA